MLFRIYTPFKVALEVFFKVLSRGQVLELDVFFVYVWGDLIACAVMIFAVS